MTDMVNNPPHYGEGTYQVINVIEAWELGYRLGNVVKYVARAHRKGHQLQDLKKAAWYLQREIEALEVLHRADAAAVIDDDIDDEKQDCRIVPPPYTRYISVYTDIAKDQFKQYSIHAHSQWTVESLASLIATQSKEWACGTFTLNVGLDLAIGGSTSNVIQLNGNQTVDWLLNNFPQDTYCYYLVKTGL